MSNNPHALVVGPFAATTGGVVTFQKNLIQHSNLKERWNFTQFNISRPAKKKIYDNHHYGAIFQSGTRRLLKGVGITAWNFTRFPLLSKKADVLQIQSSDYYSFWEAMLYTQIAKRMGKSVVVRFGGSFNIFYESSSPRIQSRIRWALKQPDQIVVQSQGWKNFFSTLTDSERLNIVPNAVPPPPPIPDRGSHKTEVKALFICSVDAKRKGVETVLGAAPSLRGKVKFIFLATPESIKEEVRKIHDSVSRDEMKHYFYPQADIFLIPSHSEGFPNSMLEAMAAGLPVVGSPAGAIPEVIEEGIHGYLNPADDIAGLAEDVRTLVENPELRHRMGKANYDLILKEYVLDKVFSRFDTIWKKAMAN
jgi:glycosyltransferase involved in cell wall biosynthesis